MNMMEQAMEALKGFDVKNGKVNNGGDSYHLESGTYNVVIKRVAMRDTPWGTEELSIVCEVFDGQAVGSREYMGLSFDLKTKTGKPNPMFPTNVKLVARLANETQVQLPPTAWNDLSDLAEAMQPAVGKLVELTVNVRPNKKNPQYPYYNYEFATAKVANQQMPQQPTQAQPVQNQTAQPQQVQQPQQAQTQAQPQQQVQPNMFDASTLPFD